MKIYVVTGEHWGIPGIIQTAHWSEHDANTQAAKLVNLIAFSKTRRRAKADTWKDVLEMVQDRLPDDLSCDVWLTALEVSGSSLPPDVQRIETMAKALETIIEQAGSGDGRWFDPETTESLEGKEEDGPPEGCFDLNGEKVDGACPVVWERYTLEEQNGILASIESHARWALGVAMPQQVRPQPENEG